MKRVGALPLILAMLGPACGGVAARPSPSEAAPHDAGTPVVPTPIDASTRDGNDEPDAPAVFFDGAPPFPVILITSPATGATVPVAPATGAAHVTLPIAFTVEGFTLVDYVTGNCSSANGNDGPNCGNIQERTDGTACNMTFNGVESAPYNNAFFQSPSNVWLDFCPSIGGAHTTVLELHNYDHSLYTCGGACPLGISASVSYAVDYPVASLALNPSTYVFETIALGLATSHAFYTSNTGSAPTNQLSIALSNTTAFSTGPDYCSGQILAPGASCEVVVTFTPHSTGAVAGEMTVTDGVLEAGAALSGSGEGPSDAGSD